MAWWERPIDALRARLAPDAGPAPADPVVASPTPTRPVAGWRDVPRIQRTLAEPLTTVAINGRFEDSLVTHTDPSFVGPLSHQVDPPIGGLVEGLVSPDTPHSHGGPDLVVPARPATTASAPRVQRRAQSWEPSAADPITATPVPESEVPDQSVDLATVALEYPVAPAESARSEAVSAGYSQHNCVRSFANGRRRGGQRPGGAASIEHRTRHDPDARPTAA